MIFYIQTKKQTKKKTKQKKEKTKTKQTTTTKTKRVDCHAVVTGYAPCQRKYRLFDL